MFLEGKRILRSVVQAEYNYMNNKFWNFIENSDKCMITIETRHLISLASLIVWLYLFRASMYNSFGRVGFRIRFFLSRSGTKWRIQFAQIDCIRLIFKFRMFANVSEKYIQLKWLKWLFCNLCTNAVAYILSISFVRKTYNPWKYTRQE